MELNLNRDNYETEALQAGEVVLIDFWGPQCRPCLALMPVVAKMTDEFEGKVKFAKVNASENRMLCAKLRVLGLPTFLIYKDGTERKRLTGQSITPKEIREAVEEVLGS